MLLGREVEIQALEQLLEGARASHGGAIVLHGEAGIGKTALAREAARRAGGFTVLEARGAESETHLAFAGLRDLLGPLLHGIDALPEPQAAALGGALALGPPAQGDRFAVYSAALGLLTASGGPTLAVVDDVHWLDQPSAEAILFAARRLAEHPVIVLIVLRQGEGDHLDLRGLPELRVEPLKDRPARELLLRRADGAPPDVVDVLLHAAGGNPLALEELPAILPPDALRGTRSLPDPLPVGPMLERALARRLERLPEETRLALLIVAAGGEGATTAVVNTLEGLGLDAGALEPAEAAEIVRIDGGRVEFRHPLMRAAAYQMADAPTRRRAHAALAAALGGDAERRAWHLAAAATGPDEEVATALESVARSAGARTALAVAARGLERAAELSIDPATAGRRRLEAAQQALLAGRLEWTRELLDAVEANPTEPLVEAEVRNLRATVLRARGSTNEARRHQHAAADIAQRHDPERAALIALNAAVSDLMAGDLDACVAAVRRAVEIAPADGGWTGRLVDAMHDCVLLVRGEQPPGSLREPIEWLSQSSAPREDIGAAARIALDFLTTSYIFYSDHQVDDLLTTLTAGIAAARAAGALGVLPYLLGNQASLLMRAGMPEPSRAMAAEGVGVARDTGQRNYLTWTLVNLARAEAVLGDHASCQAHLDEAMALARELDIGSLVTHVFAIEGLMHLTAGNTERAIAAFERCDRRVQRQHLGNPAVVPWRPDYVEALARAGRSEDALRVLEVLEAESARCGSSWGRATAARGRVLLADDDALDDAFAAAEELAARLNPVDRARTELCYGERLRRAGRRADAREPLRSAAEVFEGVGAQPWAARAREELRLAGSREPARCTPDLSNLTDQERRVAALVGRGASNQEVAAALFVSPKTVEAHLSRIYRKLDLRRRSELAHLVVAGELDSTAPVET